MEAVLKLLKKYVSFSLLIIVHYSGCIKCLLCFKQKL